MPSSAIFTCVVGRLLVGEHFRILRGGDVGSLSTNCVGVVGPGEIVDVVLGWSVELRSVRFSRMEHIEITMWRRFPEE